jgi:hypothetical protein
MARAPVSKTGGWGFESLHSCQQNRALSATSSVLAGKQTRPLTVLFVGDLTKEHLVNIRLEML